mmetsp:Transcript_33203/g.77972  ORF Transcript_33203/g.77972 Transcript_33203/m.77972 type:complete len:983 (+) Transcript_33203:326-3274(+)
MPGGGYSGNLSARATGEYRELATGSEDGSVRLWRVHEADGSSELVGERKEAHAGDYVSNVAYHPLGHILASTSAFSEIKLWALRRTYIDFATHPSRVRLSQLFALAHAHPNDRAAHALSGLAFSPDGATLASSQDSLRVWHVTSGSLELQREMALDECRATVSFSADGFELALGGEDGSVRTFWTTHLPRRSVMPFAAALRAIERERVDELVEIPSEWYGLRDLRRGAFFGWTLVHHACWGVRPRALAQLLAANPLVLIDALAPPFEGVRLMSSRTRGLDAKEQAMRVFARAPKGLPAEQALARQRIGSLAGEEDVDKLLVESVLDVALRVKSSASAKACLTILFDTLARIFKEDPVNASVLVRSRGAAHLTRSLMRVGRRHPDLLAALLPALQLVQQPGGPISLTLPASQSMFCAFSDASTPLGLVHSASSSSTKNSEVEAIEHARTRRLSDTENTPLGDKRGSSSPPSTPLLRGRLIRASNSMVGLLRHASGAESAERMPKDMAEAERMRAQQQGDKDGGGGDPLLGVARFWTLERLWWLPAPRPGSAELTMTYMSCVVPLCGDLVSWLEELEQLNGRRTRVNLYDNVHVGAIVHALWTHGAGFVHALTCAAWFALSALVVALALLGPSSVPHWVLAVGAVPFIMAELVYMLRAHTKRWYLSLGSNWADWAVYALCVLVAFTQEGDLLDVLVALLAVGTAAKGLFYLRAYTTLVNTVLQAMRDSGAFALIVFVILIAFSTARSALDGALHSGATFPVTFPFLDLFAFMLGNFNLEDYRIDGEHIVESAAERSKNVALLVLFYSFNILVSIVLLNLLITVLSDSYDLSQERRKGEWVRMRAQLVVEYHRLMPGALRVKGKWLHVLISSGLLAETVRDFDIGDKSSDDDWASRLSSLRSTLAQMRRFNTAASGRLDAKVDACSGRMDALTKRLDAISSTMQGMLAAQTVVQEPAEPKQTGPSPPLTARMRRRSMQTANDQGR